MKIVAVDDEKLALSRLVRMLAELGHSDVTALSSAEEVIEVCKREHFDLALLDIHMPHMSGLELGYELRYIDENLKIIYQSAYDEHALKAFDIGAIGYLVKPYSKEELQKSIERVNQYKPSEELRFLSKTGESYLLLKPEDIYYVKADLSEVMLRSKEGFSYIAKKISELEELLKQYNFVKIHRSYLINLDKVKEVETIEQSKLQFSFNEIKDRVDSSKDGAKHFRNRFSL